MTRGRLWWPPWPVITMTGEMTKSCLCSNLKCRTRCIFPQPLHWNRCSFACFWMPSREPWKGRHSPISSKGVKNITVLSCHLLRSAHGLALFRPPALDYRGGAEWSVLISQGAIFSWLSDAATTVALCQWGLCPCVLEKWKTVLCFFVCVLFWVDLLYREVVFIHPHIVNTKSLSDILAAKHPFPLP